MHPILSYILALIAGLITMMVVNLLVLSVLMQIIIPEVGVNMEDAKDWELEYFAVPFMAHALGSLAGAFVAAKIALKEKSGIALTIGALHLAGGTTAVLIIPAPTWFITLDLTMAYLPMAWIGWRLAR